MDKWIEKTCYIQYVYFLFIRYIYIYFRDMFINLYIQIIEHYSAIKKNEIVPLMTIWLDWEGIILSEIIWTDSKNCMISLICGVKKKRLTQETEQIGEGWVVGETD